MKFFKQLLVTSVASCVLAVGAMAAVPQKNDQKPPPPKPPQEVPKPPKEQPPPPRNDNKGAGDKKGGKP
jgi:hypothetical protein